MLCPASPPTPRSKASLRLPLARVLSSRNPPFLSPIDSLTFCLKVYRPGTCHVLSSCHWYASRTVYLDRAHANAYSLGTSFVITKKVRYPCTEPQRASRRFLVQVPITLGPIRASERATDCCT